MFGQQALGNAVYSFALPDHKGQISWSIPGFTIVENSAKSNGQEIGVRGRDESRQITFLGFLFLVPESAPLTSAKCRDAAITQEQKTNSTLKIVRTWEIARPGGLPVAMIANTTTNRDGSTMYRMRGFVATDDICGDLEFYSNKPIGDENEDLKKAFFSYRFGYQIHAAIQ